MHGNCGHCHNDKGALANLDLVLRQAVAPTALTAIVTTIGHPVKKLAPGQPADAVLRIAPHHPDRSGLLKLLWERHYLWRRVRIAVLPHLPLDNMSFAPASEAVQLATELRMRLRGVPGVEFKDPITVQQRFEMLTRQGLEGDALLQMLATAPDPGVVRPRPEYRRWGYDYVQQLPSGEVLLSSGPLDGRNRLPADTAAWVRRG